MPASPKVKIVVFAPREQAAKIREAAGQAGAGRIGNYSDCSFSSVGVGRFKPASGAQPAVGEVGKLNEVEEERIEFACVREKAAAVIAAIRAAHPYEEPVIDIYSLEEFKDFI